MAGILLNDNVLWKWMNSNNDKGMDHYLNLISEEQIDSDYIISILEKVFYEKRNKT